MAQYTAGALTNPAANAILADTGSQGQLGSGRIWVSSTVACAVVLEKRNAADSANDYSHIFPIAANAPFILSYPNMEVAIDGRIRLRLNAAATGQVQASILTD